jgi:hypothetical protein
MMPMRRIEHIATVAAFCIATGASVAMLVKVPLSNTGTSDTHRSTAIGSALIVGGLITFGIVSYIRHGDRRLYEAASNPAATLRVAHLRWKRIATAICSLMAAAGSAVILFDDTASASFRSSAAGCAAIFGFFAFGLLALRHSASLVLSPEGLDYSVFGTGPIAWSDIRGVGLKRRFESQLIALDVAREGQYQRRRAQSRPGGRVRLDEFTFSPTVVDLDPDIVLRAIEVRISTFGRRPPPAILEQADA